MSSQSDLIWRVPNAIPHPHCDDLCAFLERHSRYSERVEYAEGENTNCLDLVIGELADHPDRSYLAEHQRISSVTLGVLMDLVKGAVAPAIRPLSRPVFCPLHLRKMYGPTRNHADNVSPFVITDGESSAIAARVVTFILNISESEDELVFPRQQRVVPLIKGEAIMFPPYWMYEHYTRGPQTARGRYTLTTWLYETSPLVSGEYLRLPEKPRADGIRVLQLPTRLKSLWWESVAPELLKLNSESRPGFDSFLGEFKGYLRDRGLMPPEACEFDVVARASGQSASDGPVLSLFNLGDDPLPVFCGEERLWLESGDGCWADNDRPLKLDTSFSTSGLTVYLVAKGQE